MLTSSQTCHDGNAFHNANGQVRCPGKFGKFIFKLSSNIFWRLTFSTFDFNTKIRLQTLKFRMSECAKEWVKIELGREARRKYVVIETTQGAVRTWLKCNVFTSVLIELVWPQDFCVMAIMPIGPLCTCSEHPMCTSTLQWTSPVYTQCTMYIPSINIIGWSSKKVGRIKFFSWVIRMTKKQSNNVSVLAMLIKKVGL